MLGHRTNAASLAPCYPHDQTSFRIQARAHRLLHRREQVLASAAKHGASTEYSESLAPDAPSTSSITQPKLITQLAKEPNITRRRGLMAMGAAAMFGCQCCSDFFKADASEWQYGGDLPKSWGGVCATGSLQSPINLKLPPKITSANNYPSTPLQFKYGKAEKVAILNTGHGTMQVNFKVGNQVYVPPRILPLSNKEGSLEEYADGETEEPCLCPTVPMNLELIQYHFHTPSEHYLNGRQSPMEAHLVHRNRDTGGLAVIAVLMEAGGSTPNPCLQTGLDFAPSSKGRIVLGKRAVDPTMLLPPKSSRPYIHYQGSLTTPPCSETVDWFVMTKTIKITDRQVLDFMQFAGGGYSYAQNNRPLQSLNGRPLEYYEYNI